MHFLELSTHLQVSNQRLKIVTIAVNQRVAFVLFHHRHHYDCCFLHPHPLHHDYHQHYQLHLESQLVFFFKKLSSTFSYD